MSAVAVAVAVVLLLALGNRGGTFVDCRLQNVRWWGEGCERHPVTVASDCPHVVTIALCLETFLSYRDALSRTGKTRT